MNFKFLILIISFTLTSCVSEKTPTYSIVVDKKSEFLNNGDKIKLKLNSDNNKIENLTFKLNQIEISNDYVLETKLGENIIQASFKIDNKTYTINKKINVFSDIVPKLYTYEIVNEYKHDISSYTQGLEFDENILYESTGQYGYSTLKKIEFKTGKVLKKLFLDKSYFGEGLTIIKDRIFQLTWKKKIGFVYEKDNFELLNSFNYENSIEGWGLCNDGQHIYKSDGTEKIWKLDPKTMKEISSINVVTNNKIINKINELEWYNNKIYANTYQFNKEVGLIIDPKTGTVEGVIDFSGLKDKVKQHTNLDVLNGIAYNKIRKTFFVTGKYWDKLFEIKIFEN
ncbi:MAG: glutaminyl-peptide cyclotransferase [Flavobacteriaceae bacterium]